MATEPTAQEQYMLELVNRARLNPQAEADRSLGGNLNEGLAPGTISTKPKQPLAFDLKLEQAAQGHSQSMLEKNYFAHQDPNGSQPGDRATSAGFNWNRVGENIAWQGSTGKVDPTTVVGQQQKDLFVDTTEADRGHRTNMMDPNFSSVGISAKQGEFKQNGTKYNSVMTTQDFGKDPKSNPVLTGVVFTDKVVDDNFYTVGEGVGNVRVNAVGNDGKTYSTTTMTAGGYSLALPPGTYAVSFSSDFDRDGKVDTTAAKTVTIGTENVKQDFATDTYVPITSSAPAGPSQPSTSAPSTPLTSSAPSKRLASSAPGAPFQPLISAAPSKRLASSAPGAPSTPLTSSAPSKLLASSASMTPSMSATPEVQPMKGDDVLMTPSTSATPEVQPMKGDDVLMGTAVGTNTKGAENDFLIGSVAGDGLMMSGDSNDYLANYRTINSDAIRTSIGNIIDDYFNFGSQTLTGVTANDYLNLGNNLSTLMSSMGIERLDSLISDKCSIG